MNWELLRAHGVHVEPSGAGWAVSYADKHGRRYTPGLIHKGELWIMGQFDWPEGLRGAVRELAVIMEPVRHVTVHNLARVAAQEVFDYLALRLLMQGERSVDNDGDPAHHGAANGLKSAAGWLIPEKDYRPWMERVGLYDLLAKNWTDFHSKLVEELDDIHNEVPPRLWATELDGLTAFKALELFPRCVSSAPVSIGGVP